MAVYDAVAFGGMARAGNNAISGYAGTTAWGRFTGSGGVNFGGAGVIEGLAEVRLSSGGLALVANSRVLLLDRFLGQKVAETVSGTDGSYRFLGLNVSRSYVVVAFDPTGTYNAVVADRIVPVI